MYTLYLKQGKEKRALFHPWVYANEVAKIEGKDAQGSVAKVVSSDGRFIGYGFINHYSKIIVRIITRDETPIDKDFFFNKIKKCKDFRENLGFSDNYRVVFGESDGLPGLIIDKYSNVLVTQFLSLGMDIRKDIIVDVLKTLYNPICIYNRSDVSVREKEGLPLEKGVLYGTLPSNVIITENGIKMYIDVENGQKTGYFLDQKENRDNLKKYVKNKTVLDCFCNQGGFSLCASKYGAKEITAVDVSDLALDSVNNNAKLNNFTNIKTLNADVFEYLRECKKNDTKFDVIILDPPAFTKTADTVQAGYKGYLDINTIALKLLNENGVLITCSCSQHMTVPLFTKMLTEASQHAHVPAKLVELRTQAADHASLLTLDEALYLKVAVLIKD